MKKRQGLVLVGAFALAFAIPAAAAFNGFANFGDIKGESTDKDHKEWVMIVKYDHAVTQPPSVTQKTAGGGHGTVQLTFRSADMARRLTEGQASGRRRPEVVIDLNCQPNGRCERHVFTNVLVSSAGKGSPNSVYMNFTSQVVKEWKPAVR